MRQAVRASHNPPAASSAAIARDRCFAFIVFCFLIQGDDSFTSLRHCAPISGSWLSIWNEGGEFWRQAPASRNEPDPQSWYGRPAPEEHLERVVKAVQSTSEDTGLSLLVGRIGFQARLDQIDLPALIVISGKNPNRKKIALEAKQLKSPEIPLGI